MYPVLFEIGPITIYSLGIFWALGAIPAVGILRLELRRCGYNAEFASTVVMVAAIGGLIGARLLFIIEEHEVKSKVETGYGSSSFSQEVGVL